jgi:hypothetical protein
MRNVPKIILMVAFLVGLGPEMARALPVIDQQQPIFSVTTGFQTGATDLAQTFTVGVGTRSPQ